MMIETTCVHYWTIAAANGPKSPGRCKKCGEKREFANHIYMDPPATTEAQNRQRQEARELRNQRRTPEMGREMQRLRLEAAVAIETMAEMLGVTIATVYAMERGETIITENREAAYRGLEA